MEKAAIACFSHTFLLPLHVFHILLAAIVVNLGSRQSRWQAVAVSVAAVEEDPVHDGLPDVDEEEARGDEEHGEGEVGIALQVGVIHRFLSRTTFM